MDETSLTELQRTMLRTMLVDLQVMSTSELAAHRSRFIDEAQQVIGEQSELRQVELRQLFLQGHTYADLGRLCELSGTRIQQLMTEGPRPERVLMGTGTAQMVIALAGKWEAAKPSGPPQPAVSVHALAAYRELSDLASSYGLRTTYEVVHPDGLIDLNRRNLVVLGSPRVLAPMRQALRSDPNLGFAVDLDGKWCLTEGQRKWHSPADEGEHSDLAYIGRMRRPDGRGELLYLAGIHGQGTRGAVRYFAEHIGEIFEQVGRNRWSALVRCDYDPETHEITSTELFTELKTYVPLHVDPEDGQP